MIVNGCEKEPSKHTHGDLSSWVCHTWIHIIPDKIAWSLVLYCLALDQTIWFSDTLKMNQTNNMADESIWLIYLEIDAWLIFWRIMLPWIWLILTCTAYTRLILHVIMQRDKSDSAVNLGVTWDSEFIIETRSNESWKIWLDWSTTSFFFRHWTLYTVSWSIASMLMWFTLRNNPLPQHDCPVS